ncbi:hypothetical protein VNO78_06248 [Psophocarpus tetragonolobus]|uniref:C-JID domain-containing protein n=1 Tax=Psophocarpus tetragonolobus TaxID=3891 RepID=A0AAN9XS08_PSOTE
MPDLTGIPHLEKLDLEGCIKVVKIDPSIGTLRELWFLNLKNCESLFLNLNIIVGLSSLKSLTLSGCSKLLNNRLSEKPRDKNKSAIQLSTSSACKMLMLSFSFFSSRKSQYSLCLLVPYLSRFPLLYHLDLSFCNLLQIPDAIGNLHSLIHWQAYLSFNKLCVVIPGSEIPRWFSKQKVGHVISMDMSRVMNDPNWIGVACCALLVAHDHPTNFGDRWSHRHHGSISYSFLSRTYFTVPIHLENDLVTGELDHLLILFYSREQLLRYRSEYEDEMIDLDKREFSTHNPKGLRLEVKKCAYRWVYKEDLQQLNPDMMFRANSSSRKRADHMLLSSN